MSKLSKNSKRILGVAAACLMLAGWSASSQAQTCTVANWAGGPTGLTNGDTGTPIDGNRRYAGPCGLRVPVDGTARYLTDDSPAAESTYIARFYVFLENAGSDEVVLFSADDGTAAKIQISYNAPTAGDLTLDIVDSSDVVHPITFEGVGGGWQSVEFVWEAAASAAIVFSLNGTDQTNTLDTSGITLANANLGNIDGAGSGGGASAIDFDDFDSRRSSRPGRLCRGDVNGSDSITQVDMLTVFNEVASGGTVLASGQPDYNESGSVTQTDALQILNQHVSVGASGCP